MQFQDFYETHFGEIFNEDGFITNNQNASYAEGFDLIHPNETIFSHFDELTLPENIITQNTITEPCAQEFVIQKEESIAKENTLISEEVITPEQPDTKGKEEVDEPKIDPKNFIITPKFKGGIIQVNPTQKTLFSVEPDYKIKSGKGFIGSLLMVKDEKTNTFCQILKFPFRNFSSDAPKVRNLNVRLPKETDISVALKNIGKGDIEDQIFVLQFNVTSGVDEFYFYSSEFKILRGDDTDKKKKRSEKFDKKVDSILQELELLRKKYISDTELTDKMRKTAEHRERMINTHEQKKIQEMKLENERIKEENKKLISELNYERKNSEIKAQKLRKIEEMVDNYMSNK